MDKDMTIADFYAADSTWSDVILDHALNFPDRPALVFHVTSVTYGQLNPMSEECATYLGRKRLGQVVCMAMLFSPRPSSRITLRPDTVLEPTWEGLKRL